MSPAKYRIDIIEVNKQIIEKIFNIFIVLLYFFYSRKHYITINVFYYFYFNV